MPKHKGGSYMKEALSVFSIYFTLASLTTVIVLVCFPSISSIPPSPLPSPPDSGTPSSSSEIPGSRPGNSCRDTSDKPPLTVLNHGHGEDFTLSEYPTFWFYIPYGSSDIRYMEFVLLNRDETTTIYRTAILLTQPGIIRIRVVPSEAGTPLSINTTYRWQLKFDCQPDTLSGFDGVLGGWIRRVSEPPGLQGRLSMPGAQAHSVYERNFIWYDAVNSLAEVYFNAPQNGELHNAWTDLMTQLGHEDLASENFSEASQVPARDR